MTFSYETKRELCKISSKNDCCKKAELYSLLLFSRFFSKSSLTTEHIDVARRISEMTAEFSGAITEIRASYKGKGYEFLIPDSRDKERIFSLFSKDGKFCEVIGENIENECCIASFLRGMFLSCASVSNPNKQYNLEFVFADEILADSLMNFISEFNFFKLKKKIKNNKTVLYMKDSVQIEDFLTFIGATKASMELMQMKMYKEAVNNINRKSNFETANIDKTISASARQTAAIAYISDKKGLNFLDENLKEIAILRLENPQMSLKEIAESLNVSRSKANHKLTKILNIYEKMIKG